MNVDVVAAVEVTITVVLISVVAAGVCVFGRSEFYVLVGFGKKKAKGESLL